MISTRKKKHVALFRRRRKGKTDYRKRRGIIVGGQNFLTASVSGRYIQAQIHKAEKQGDVTLCSSSSRDLSKNVGWKGSGKNLASAYLTGYLLGKKSLARGIENASYYSGPGRFVHGSRMASLISGAKDAGLDIPIGQEALPEKGRQRGEHIAKYSRALEDQDKNAFNRIFSKVLASGIDPKQYPGHFDEVKLAIDRQLSGADAKG